MIRTFNVSKQFDGQIAVADISLHVKRGEIFGLVGPDGAGKTTLMRLLLGLLTPTAGSIQLLGSAGFAADKARLGYVPQRFSLYGDLTVMENIRLFGALYGAAKQDMETRACEILAFTQLLAFKNRLADNLSGGMKQKLALAAALMHQPELFLLDEPTTGVDPVSRREFWQMLYQLHQQGTTIFVSTPYMEEAELCSRIAFQQNGRLTALGTPTQLKQAYPHRLLELELQDAVRNLRQRLHGDFLLDIDSFGSKYHLVVTDPQLADAAIRRQLAAQSIRLQSLREIEPGLEDLFVALSGKGGPSDARGQNE